MTKHLVTVASAVLLVGCSGGGGSRGGVTGPPDGAHNPTVTYTGEFHAVEADGMGMVTATKTGDVGNLQFGTDFAIQNGPNLEVWLVAAADAQDNATVTQSSHVSLGPLQNASGAQTYTIPSKVDLSQYRSVTIWCVSAHVNFATAPLTMK